LYARGTKFKSRLRWQLSH